MADRIRNLAQAIDACRQHGIRLEDFPLNHEIHMCSDGTREIVDVSAERAEVAGRAALITFERP